MSLLHYLLLLNSKLWEQNHQLGSDERVNMLYNIILRNQSNTVGVLECHCSYVATERRKRE